VKLLLDQNLSPRLIASLVGLYPESAHVKDLGMERASDADLWEFALEHGFTIVSKDSDFHQRSFLHGPPPKVVWIRLGNCTTSEILEILTARHREVIDFGDRPVEAFLVLDR